MRDARSGTLTAQPVAAASTMTAAISAGPATGLRSSALQLACLRSARCTVSRPLRRTATGQDITKGGPHGRSREIAVQRRTATGAKYPGWATLAGHARGVREGALVPDQPPRDSSTDPGRIHTRQEFARELTLI